MRTEAAHVRVAMQQLAIAPDVDVIERELVDMVGQVVPDQEGLLGQGEGVDEGASTGTHPALGHHLLMQGTKAVSVRHRHARRHVQQAGGVVDAE